MITGCHNPHVNGDLISSEIHNSICLRTFNRIRICPASFPNSASGGLACFRKRVNRFCNQTNRAAPHVQPSIQTASSAISHETGLPAALASPVVTCFADTLINVTGVDD
jgi:hypothetical protein